MSFKVGDKVVCNDNRYYEEKLTVGKVYVATYMQNSITKVVSDSGCEISAFSDRFSLVENDFSLEKDEVFIILDKCSNKYDIAYTVKALEAKLRSFGKTGVSDTDDILVFTASKVTIKTEFKIERN